MKPYIIAESRLPAKPKVTTVNNYKGPGIIIGNVAFDFESDLMFSQDTLESCRMIGLNYILQRGTKVI